MRTKLLLLLLLALPSLLVAQRTPPRAVVVEESDGLPPGRQEVPKGPLGQQLFSDPVLSSNGKVSCATCHLPDHGFASKGLPEGLDGKPLAFKAPTLFNRGAGKRHFWDGRSSSLEDQFKAVMTNPKEMGNRTLAEAAARVNDKYGTDLTEDQLTKAVVDFEKTITREPGKFGKFIDGSLDDGLSRQEKRGWDIFRGAGHCYECHKMPNFTDEELHDTKTGGRFKTPTLWGCSLTAPYFHDASKKDLGEVIEHYNRTRNLKLGTQQKADLEAFLKSL